MSWFYGICRREPDCNLENHLSRKKSILSINTSNLSINVGGNHASIFFKKVDNESGWLILGVGIISNQGNYQVLNQSQWEKLLHKNEFNYEQLNGHFILIRWDKDKIKFQTDRLGLRDFYFIEKKDSITFSTRLDWLKDSNTSQIDFHEFGSRWLLFNQLSMNSIVKNITRIVGGQSLIINKHSFNTEIGKSFWIPKLDRDESRFLKQEYSDSLEKIILAKSESNTNISLSLSGGLDSRVLLSYFLKNKKKIKWDTHTFGLSSSSDYEIADKISRRYEFPHELLNRAIPDFETIKKELQEYTAQSIVNNSASAILQLGNYKLLKSRQNAIIIDGGFGEIWRREFLAKLFFQGRQALIHKDIPKIISLMKLKRADIFTEEINSTMNDGCLAQLEDLMNELPAAGEIGIENWIDLLAIKTRLPNYYGHEQARLDSMIVCFMPFIQIDLLNNILQMPVELRKNAKLYRQIIEENEIGLTKIGLAKSSFVHPFGLTTLQTRLWNKIVKQFHLQKFMNDATLIFLNELKEYINDLSSSSDFKQCGIYDINKVQGILSRFNYNKESFDEVDWLLSFEIFRGMIK